MDNKNIFPEWIKKRIKEHYYEKYKRIAPEGFVLVREEVIEDVKDKIHWEEFKKDDKWLDSRNKYYLLKEVRNSEEE